MRCKNLKRLQVLAKYNREVRKNAYFLETVCMQLKNKTSTPSER